MRIDLEWLRAHGVRCESELGPFSRTFPDGAEVTRETLHQAAQSGRHLDWLAHRILEPADLPVFLERAGALRRAMEASEACSRAACVKELNTVTHLGGGVACRPPGEDTHARHLLRLDDAQRAYKASLADALADILRLP